LLATLLLGITVMAAGPGSAEAASLLIRNARLIDATGAPARETVRRTGSTMTSPNRTTCSSPGGVASAVAAGASVGVGPRLRRARRSRPATRASSSASAKGLVT